MATEPRVMTVQERIETALDFLTESDREFESGDTMQASEKLWGAFSHAVTAIAMQRKWKHGTHRELLESANRLTVDDGASYHNPVDLGKAVPEARHFHDNFYNGHLTDYEIESGRPIVKSFVQWAVNIARDAQR